MRDDLVTVDIVDLKAIIREQIVRLNLGTLVQQQVALATDPELRRLTYEREQRDEQVQIRSANERAGRSLEAVAPMVKQMLLDQAAKYGPIQLRFNRWGPAALEWVPCEPWVLSQPGSWRR